MYLERALQAWLGFVQPVNVDLYFVAGEIAEAARLGATWRCRVMFSVRVAETATLGGVAPINVAVARKTRRRDWRIYVVPMFQTRIHQDGAFRIQVEEEETIFKRGNAPSEAISGRVTYTTAAAILYAGLALGEEGCL